MKEHLGRRSGLLTAMRQAKDLSASERHVVEYVLENLKNMTDKTVVIVTHRMKALDICNKVAHFSEQGVTVENK